MEIQACETRGLGLHISDSAVAAAMAEALIEAPAGTAMASSQSWIRLVEYDAL